MELRHLRYFCVVADELNLTRAAQRLHMAQPPLTRQIKQLEDEIGVTLFERSRRGLTLTTAGQFFYEHTLQVLEKLDTTITATRRIARSNLLMFGIGFVPSLFYGQLPLLVRGLRQKDNVELSLVELTTVQQIQALKAGRIDIGFGRLQIDDPDVEQEVLFEEPFIAALPAGHPLENTQPTLAELARYPLILFPASPRPSLADVTLGLFRRRGLKISVAQEANELQTALGLVASDLGITLVPEQVGRLKRDNIVYVSLAEKHITTPIICSRRRGEPPSPVMQEANAILEVLVENRRSGRYP
ncbi:MULTISPECIES: LysR family transcriptional regulator [Chromohalobacter]|uniref:LysR family transcriptional regulator n=1 Tax=Chromohalobacter TaxID=42054 RepID=UPI000D716E38|nr:MULTISPECIES: LysR family transcriptional regulator [Chromohalobacter]MDO0945178.1 LysR family transcriptional regulator [Chromohalobacter salexigens]NQY47279.1 LysR family transcriptional regulator [Chromohalobacter sp.]NWO55638.1 LysR family transcriptional regulator [Chromohalobacter salexigens]PWW42703.1 DNA-binding transcriptional LysR family regulator [Chromohalobacter salexigens]